MTRPGKGCLSYVLISDSEAVVVDPSQYSGEYEAVLSEYDAELVGIYDTHAHADHVSGGRKLADRQDVPYYLHPADADHVDAASVDDGATFTVGNVDVTVYTRPATVPAA